MALAGTLLLAAPRHADAQIRASELQTVAQTVDGTTIRITYSRPRLRGRWPMFGTKAVQWGEVWTPGANAATILESDRDVTIGGTKVPKGKYSVWMIVSQDSTWTMLLDPKWSQFHMDHPKPNPTQLRVTVRVDTTAALEDVLTWSFPAVSPQGGVLAMHWARTRITVPFRVQPTMSALLAEGEARPYVGTYLLTDPKTKKQDGKLIVTYNGGGLKARFEPEDTYMQTFALMRAGNGIFAPGLYAKAEVYADGEIYEVLKPDMMFTFSLKGGVMTLECRAEDDSLIFTGSRLP